MNKEFHTAKCRAIILAITLLPGMLMGASKPGGGRLPIADANNAFAFDLYQRLAADQALANQNLFFSPYSITAALDMVAEGAREETAEQMGTVLRYPAAWRRAGANARLRPWDEAPLHAGVEALTRRFTQPPVPAKLAAQVEALRKECAAAVAAADKMSEGPDVKAYRLQVAKSQKLSKQFDALVAQLPGYELTTANALWAEKTYPFGQEYMTSVSRHYAAGLLPADFLHDAGGVRLKINDWIARQTKDKIKDMLQPPAVDAETRLVLVNAIYFKGKWLEPFDAELTRPGEFMTSTGKPSEVAMMSEGEMPHASYAAFQGDGSLFPTPKVMPDEVKPGTLYPDEKGFLVAELPYQGDGLVMTIFAPQSFEGLPALEKMLTADKVREWTGRLEQRGVAVTLPKFTFKTSYDLKQPLSALGMPRAFTWPGAQFDGISATKELYIGLVQHDAFVDVNEKGTEAAAVTVVAMAPGLAAPGPRLFIPEFRADRPFLFLIRDRVTDVILFVGRVLRPEAAGLTPRAPAHSNVIPK